MMKKAQYAGKSLEVLRQMPLKKSKYASVARLDEMLGEAEIKALEIKAVPENAATINYSPKEEELIEAVELEEPPKDQYEAKANTAIGKAAIVKINENARGIIRLKIISREKSCGKAVVVIPKNTGISIIEEHSAGKGSIISETIIVGENSIVNYARKTKPEAEAAIYRQFIIGENSRLVKCDSWNKGNLVRSNTAMILRGHGAEGNEYSFLLGSGKENFDINYSSVHRGKGTKSHCIFKSAMKDESKGTFDGMIKIEENGEKTNALLECHAMILGEKATSNQIPGLEIKTDDVKATHSATVVHVAEDELFYLQSRGITEDDARKIVVKSFLESVVFMMPENMRQELELEIEQRL